MQTEIVQAFGIAAGVIGQPQNLVLLALATAVGLFIGMLPGLGGTVVIALLIPLTFAMDPLVAFMILVAANGGTSQGGAITAILINTPGKAPNAATILDGYPLARQGRAGEAIGASATASAFGAILGIAVLVVMIPFMLQFVLMFSSAEIFWLGIWGLTLLAVVVSGDVASGLISGAFGLLFSMHGVHNATALARWTYGLSFMLDGFKLVPALIGLFAVAEMINLVSQGEQISMEEEESEEGEILEEELQGRFQGAKAVFVHWSIFLRSALIGTFIGAIPGVGGTAANYVAYFQAVQTSDNPETFGTGDIRGVIASEASNDAKEGGAYIPTLGFGVPGSSSMAVLFGAFLLHGITPGPLLMQNHLDVVGIVVLSALVSNVVSSIFGMATANQLTKLTQIDIMYLAPMVIGVAFFGSYALQNNVYNLAITAFFGVLGFVMIKINMSRVPMILGMVLGPIVETEFFRALQISGNDYAIFVNQPLDWILILLILIGLFLPYIRGFVRNRGVTS
ncbi:MAG: tripartite tricarboxylate transporter permease [Haloferacaceae archaeon]